MRRWNGWGDDTTNYPLPDSAAAYLAGLLGEGLQLEETSFKSILASVGTSRLPVHPLLNTRPEERLRHARGQSLPDWIAMSSGNVGVFPDGVAFPGSDAEVRSLLDYAQRTGVKVIPYGGGTSVVGHINPLPGDSPILTIDLSRLNHLLALDETSHLAIFEAGVPGPELEKQLNSRGYTLGHFPQSFEFSTLGGWIATRSSGQQSLHYGRIENLFAGGHVETPLGVLELPTHPSSAAGPDLKQLLLGSEGRLGVITRATVRVRRLPAWEKFLGYFFHDWEAGAIAVREIVQAGIPVSMLRMSNAMETTTTLALAGKESLVRLVDRGLRLLRYGDGRSLLVMGITDESGSRPLVRNIKGEAEHIIRSHGGLPTGTMIGKMWKKSRFYSPYLRNTLWTRGYALDTVETAVPWAAIPETAQGVQEALAIALAEFDERVLAFAHLSHVYNDGASVYTTYLFRRLPDPEQTLHHWQLLKKAASRVIVSHGGTISHQHGVGVDHAPYLVEEKGRVGMRVLETLVADLDPDRIMNPGKLLES